MEHIKAQNSLWQEFLSYSQATYSMERFASKRLSSFQKQQWRSLQRPLQIEAGDVLYTAVGSYGRAAVVQPGLQFAFQRHIAHLKPARDTIDPNYLKHFLNSPSGKAQADKVARGAAQKTVTLSDLKNFQIPCPTLAEQRRIAAILDQADALRAKRRRTLEQLNEMAQAIFVEMFGDPIANDQKLAVKPLGCLIDPLRPITYGILMPGPDHPGGVPYIRVVDMAGGTVKVGTTRRTSPEIAKQYERSKLQSGDLLISIRGHVGRVAVTPPVLDGANITQDTARLAVTRIDPVFLQGLMQTSSIKEWMARRTKGAAVQGLNLGDLRLLPVIEPSPALQKQYRQRVEALSSVQLYGRDQASHLDDLFASLQHRAFRGEL